MKLQTYFGAMVSLLLILLVSLGAKSGAVKPGSDPGFLFQDEVTKEIVIDVHRDHSNVSNPFEDLSGKFKPESFEYRALLLAAGLSSDAVSKADENIEVKSLKTLRVKFDQEFKKLSAEASATNAVTAVPIVEVQPVGASPEMALTGAIGDAATDKPTDKPSSRAITDVSATFSEVGEAGFTDPKLGDYRLIPLERGLMMAGKSGEKRVFSSREVLKDDVFSVAIGESGTGDRVLAILHQPRKQAGEEDAKFTVWVLALSGSQIVWTKTLEFPGGIDSSSRSTASEQMAGKDIDLLPAFVSQITLSSETVSIAIGGSTKKLTLKTGETADASSLTPASEN